MFATRSTQSSSFLLLLLTILSLLHLSAASLSAIIATLSYTNSSTIAPYTNMSTPITTPTATTTIPPVVPATTPSLFLTTEVETGAGGPSTITTYVMAGGGATGTQSAATGGATTTGPQPGVQTGAAGRSRRVEGALWGVAALAGWMVVCG